MGAQATNQQTVPGVRIDLSNVRGTTRFNDLQEDLQKKIVWLEDQIQSYMNQKHELDAFMPGHGDMLSNIPNDVKFVQMKYDGVESALRSDAEAIESVQLLHQKDIWGKSVLLSGRFFSLRILIQTRCHSPLANTNSCLLGWPPTIPQMPLLS